MSAPPMTPPAPMASFPRPPPASPRPPRPSRSGTGDCHAARVRRLADTVLDRVATGVEARIAAVVHPLVVHGTGHARGRCTEAPAVMHEACGPRLGRTEHATHAAHLAAVATELGSVHAVAVTARIAASAHARTPRLIRRHSRPTAVRA